MGFFIECADCGRSSRKYSLERKDLLTVAPEQIAGAGWNSLEGIFYCPECAETWRARHNAGSRHLAGKNRTMRAIERAAEEAKNEERRIEEEKRMVLAAKPKAVCTNSEARARFRKTGLRYADISEEDIKLLIALLDKEYRESNTKMETSAIMDVCDVFEYYRDANGNMQKCYIWATSFYFRKRECISFNADGFIGFCGWAEDNDANPVRRAFLAWCADMARKKASA